MPPDPPGPVSGLHRHRLVCLHGWAWADVLAHDWDAVARACLGHWAEQGLPLVVTTQRAADINGDGGGDAHGDAEPLVCLGLAAPLQWQRRRLALQAPHAAIASQCEFPSATDIVDSLPAHSCAAFAALARRVADSGADMRVFGSHGWQRLTGLDHVRDGSDVDLWVAVDGAVQADTVCDLLLSFAHDRPRLDGELMFADGSAVHWREWAAWRRGETPRLLVKRLDGAVLAQALDEVVAA